MSKRVLSSCPHHPANLVGEKNKFEGKTVERSGEGQSYNVLRPLDGIPFFVQKYSCYPARPRVQIFVSAPHSEINVPVVQVKRYVSNCMRKIPAADAALKAQKINTRVGHVKEASLRTRISETKYKIIVGTHLFLGFSGDRFHRKPLASIILNTTE